MSCAPDLQALNFADGLNPIRKKLPLWLANKWRTLGTAYERRYGTHPPFSVFCNFLEEKADEHCNPNYTIETATVHPPLPSSNRPQRTLRTSFQPKDSSTSSTFSAFHKTTCHSTSECSAFTVLDIDVKRTFARTLSICFRCLGNHHARSCAQVVKCDVCYSADHSTMLHKDKPRESHPAVTYHHPSDDSTDPPPPSLDTASVLCSKVCQKAVGGRGCGKTLLVDVALKSAPHKQLRAYAIIDEQSDQSFAAPQLFDFINISSPAHSYTLTTLSKHKTALHGRIAHNLIIKGAAESQVFPLPSLFKNTLIPDTKDEVATQ